MLVYSRTLGCEVTSKFGEKVAPSSNTHPSEADSFSDHSSPIKHRLFKKFLRAVQAVRRAVRHTVQHTVEHTVRNTVRHTVHQTIHQIVRRVDQIDAVREGCIIVCTDLIHLKVLNELARPVANQRNSADTANSYRPNKLPADRPFLVIRLCSFISTVCPSNSFQLISLRSSPRHLFIWENSIARLEFRSVREREVHLNSQKFARFSIIAAVIFEHSSGDSFWIFFWVFLLDIPQYQLVPNCRFSTHRFPNLHSAKLENGRA